MHSFNCTVASYDTLNFSVILDHNRHWWLTHSRPVRVGLHCQARCDHHPWRQCSLYGLNLQLDNGSGSSHPCPPLHWLKRWQSDHTCLHPHRLDETATKSEKWNGKLRLEWVYGRYPPSKTPGHAGVKGNDQRDMLTGIATLTSGLLLVTALRYCAARVHIISFRIPLTHC